MTFIETLKATYRGSNAFLFSCPLLALFPVIFELIQHGVEFHLGMYGSIAAAMAMDHSPLRLSFGLIKVAALLISGYWVPRYLAYRDPVIAAQFDPTAIHLFTGFFVFQMALAAFQLFCLPQTGFALLAALLGGSVISILLAAWGIAAPLGNRSVGLRESVLMMWRQLPWTLAFSIIAMLPLMVPHYALGALAIFGPKVLLWPALIVDSLLVGWLAVVLLAINYYAATRAAAKVRVSLRLEAADWDGEHRVIVLASQLAPALGDREIIAISPKPAVPAGRE